MKILYLDLGAGAEGDMLAGALLGLLDEDAREDALRKLNAALPADVQVGAETARQYGVTGLRFCVSVDGESEHPGEPTPHQSPSATADPSGLFCLQTCPRHVCHGGKSPQGEA